MKIEISLRELAGLMAAQFCLLKSSELKRGGTYLSNINDLENCLRISFKEAADVNFEFLERAINKFSLEKGRENNENL